MSDEQYAMIYKWLAAIHKRMVSLYVAGAMIICAVVAVFNGDWIGTASLMFAAQAIVLITDRSRNREHEEMRDNGFGHLVPKP